jgi:hypothetical protein
MITDPLSIDATVVQGEQETVVFTLRNTGASVSGVTVLLPAVEWVSMASPATGRIDSLGSQQSAAVTLLLSPSNTTALGDFTGSLVISSLSPAFSRFVSITLRVVSSSFG